MNKRKTNKTVGIDSLIDNNKPTREKGRTSMFIDKQLLRQFKINLIKINKSQIDFFDAEIINYIANYNKNPPPINAKTDNSVQYIVTIYKDTSKELNLFCAENEILIRDIFVFLMNQLNEQVSLNTDL